VSDVVFLIGAGRSGTTLLYKLLALHSDIAVINNYDQRFLAYSPGGMFLRLLRPFPNAKKALWFSEGGGAYFRPGLKRLLPYPVEGESVYTRCGVPLVIDDTGDVADQAGPCLRRAFKRMRARYGGQVFLTKRTANNRRLEWLRAAFPDAKFINLLRDGREVAYSLSTVRWWDDHVIWWSGKTPREMEAAGWDRLRVCARNWVEEVTSLETGMEGVPAGKRIDVRYEALLREPEKVMDELLSFLSIDKTKGFSDAIESLGLKERRPKWEAAWTEEQAREVLEIERDLLSKHGYV
jgi:hypothetical protein